MKLTTLGLVGLGKMGNPLARNMQRNGFKVLAYDENPDNRRMASADGIETTSSLAGVVLHLPKPKVIWVMVPEGEATESVIDELSRLLEPGDTIIDGGNSNFNDSLRRYGSLKEKGIHFIDCGTSGGTGGALNGACTMVGGEPEAYAPLKALFTAISVKGGHLHTGAAGSGHFVKMVHNGIGYGMMQVIAEGFEVMEKSQFELDIKAVAKVWNHGPAIRGWLIGLLENAFSKDPKPDAIKGGEGLEGGGGFRGV